MSTENKDSTIAPSTSENEEKQRMRLLIWAACGACFIISSYIFLYSFDDEGFVSALAAMMATGIMLIPLLRTVINDWCKKQMRMHELAVIAVVASAVQGQNDGFKSSALIAFFMLISIFIETKTASGVKASLEALAKLAPGKARRKIAESGETELVEAKDLSPDDILIVQPGENILADGEIIQGTSSINEANINGESIPVDKQQGDKVFAGTNNINGLLQIRVSRAGSDTTIGRIREMILKAEHSRLPFVRLVDEYIRYYIPIIFTATGVILYFNRFEVDMLERVVAALVIACPVALILATPTAAVAALSAAARAGVLVKDIKQIEAFASTNAFVFDKTGTLTESKLEIAAVNPVNGQSAAILLKAALIAESASTHPVAQAVREFALSTGLKPVHPDKLHEEAGRGVQAQWQGKTILAGNLKWMQENGLTSEDFESEHLDRGASMSLLFISIDKAAVGWIGLADTIRDDAKSCLEGLKEENVRFLGIVSGDRQEVVNIVGAKLGTEGRFGSCSPSDKVEHIKKLQEQSYKVAFLGDGVNDGPALASADIGISMGAVGSDVAIESSSISLMNNQLNRLPFLLRLAKNMRSIIVQNFILGAFIILGGLGLAASGELAPVLASVFQVVAALLVVMNSARLIRQGENLGPDSTPSTKKEEG